MIVRERRLPTPRRKPTPWLAERVLAALVIGCVLALLILAVHL